METPKNLTEEITISDKIEKDLGPSIDSYKELKNRLRESLSIWSPEVSEWLDENARSLEEIGMTLSFIGKVKEKENNPTNLKTFERYRNNALALMKKRQGGCPDSFQSWLDDSSPREMKEAGALMQQAGSLFK